MDWKTVLFEAICFLSCWLLLVSAHPTTKATRSPSLSEFKDEARKRSIMRLSKAFEMHNLMDESVNPCDDFYQFACGTWSRINKASSQPTTGFFDKLSEDQSRKVLGALQESSHPGETETDKKVQRFFKSCIKLFEIPVAEHKKTLYGIIEEFGSMPAIVGDSWDGTHFDWLETAAKIQHKYGIQAIIGVDVIPDFKDNSFNRMYLGEAEMTLESKSMYVDDENAVYREMYAMKLTDLLRKNLDLSTAVANATAREIVAFEVELAKGKLDDKVKKSFKNITVLTTTDAMNAKYAPLDYKKYMNISFGEDIKEPFYEVVEEFQKNLKITIESTPKRIVANYIFYQLVSEFFPKVASNKKDQEQLCMGAVKKQLAKNLDNMMYRRYNAKSTEHDITTIWNEIKNSFRRELRSNKLYWIANTTRVRALEKLDAMAMDINSYSSTDFDNEFKDLVINNADYIYNMKNIYMHEVKRKIMKIHELPKPFEAGEELSYTPANIIIENAIKIPVSLLQPYYFWADNYPMALTFGTLGFLLGHELIHGFDDAGREYDEHGNEANWWDDESTDSFINRTSCFTDQYHKYIFGGMHLPKSQAQSENIADNGGLQIAYDAYLTWLREATRRNINLNDEVLPNMNYTNKQLFFISFAQVWCSDIHPSMMALQMATDDHTPEKYRVIGVLSNSLEFASEFNCPEGSKMHPKERCEIY